MHSRRQILQLWIPASLEAVFQMSLGLVDQVIIGRLGDGAVAAAALTNQILFFLTLVLGTLASAGAIFVAQRHGQGDRESVRRTVGACVQLAILVALPLTGILIASSPAMLTVLGADAEVSRIGQPFLRLMLIALPIILVSAVAVGTLRSVGDSRTPMVVTLGSVVLNSLVGVVLVCGVGPVPALGIMGAGYATLFAQTARLLAFLLILHRRGLSSTETIWRYRAAAPFIQVILKLGAPIALAQVLWALGNLCYTFFCGRLGRSALVANQVIIAVESVFIMCSSGLGVAGLTIVGQWIGAGDIGRAIARSRDVILLGLKVSFLMSLGVLATRWAVPVIYPNLSGQALALAALGLSVNAFAQPAKVMNIIMGEGVLRAGGDTRFLMIANAISIYAIGVPLAVLLSESWTLGLLGVLLAKTAEEVARVVIYFLRYRTPRWRHALALTTS